MNNDSQVFVQQSQQSSKAIKKKSLLNFRAIKNNYVVKPTNTGMSMVEHDAPSQPKGTISTGSSLATTGPRRNGGVKIRNS